MITEIPQHLPTGDRSDEDGGAGSVLQQPANISEHEDK